MTDLTAAVAGIAKEVARQIVREELAKLRPDDAGERLLTVAEVAKRTGRGRSTVHRWIALGQLPTKAVPGRGEDKEIVCVRARDLDEWIRGLPAGRRSAVQDGADGGAAAGARGSTRGGRLAAGGQSVHDQVMERANSKGGRGRRHSAGAGQRSAS